MTRPFRRRVLYLPGFDPIPPRRYRELYRREGAAQARISGYDLSIRRVPQTERYGWNVVMDGGSRRPRSASCCGRTSSRPR